MVGGDDAVARCPSNRNPRAPNPPANTLCDLFPRLIADLHSNSTAAGSGSTWLATGGNTIAESNMGCTGHFFSIRTEGYVPDARRCPCALRNPTQPPSAAPGERGHPTKVDQRSTVPRPFARREAVRTAVECFWSLLVNYVTYRIMKAALAPPPHSPFPSPNVVRSLFFPSGIRWPPVTAPFLSSSSVVACAC